MKLSYIANIRLPTEKAHGIQIMKTCEALLAAGADVELIVSRRDNPITEDAFSYYGTKRNFRLTYVPSIDALSWGNIGALVQAASFALAVLFRIPGRNSDVIYSRNVLPLFVLSFIPSLRNTLVWESHMGHWGFMVKRILARAPLVVITNGLADFYAERGVPRERIHVSPDAVEMEMFDIPVSKREARARLGLPADKTLVLYTGHLYDWKGAHVLAEAAREMPQGTEVVFVGGTAGDIESFTKRFGGIPAVKILGKKPHAEMPMYMKAADILVIPNSGKQEISARFTSPMKLFEYMAAGRPIVASDLPSLREVLDESMAYFAQPDDAQDLARAVKEAISHPDAAGAKAEKAHDAVRDYSWSARARAIIAFLQNTMIQ